MGVVWNIFKTIKNEEAIEITRRTSVLLELLQVFQEVIHYSSNALIHMSVIH